MNGIRAVVAGIAIVALLGALFVPAAVAYNGPDNQGNSGNEVSNGNSPQPSGGGGGGSHGESNGNPGNEVSNGNKPQPKK